MCSLKTFFYYNYFVCLLQPQKRKSKMLSIYKFLVIYVLYVIDTLQVCVHVDVIFVNRLNSINSFYSVTLILSLHDVMNLHLIFRTFLNDICTHAMFLYCNFITFLFWIILLILKINFYYILVMLDVLQEHFTLDM